MRGVPLAASKVQCELTTPTGAAILAEIVDAFERPAAFVAERDAWAAAEAGNDGMGNDIGADQRKDHRQGKRTDEFTPGARHQYDGHKGQNRGECRTEQGQPVMFDRFADGGDTAHTPLAILGDGIGNDDGIVHHDTQRHHQPGSPEGDYRADRPGWL